MMVLMLKKGGIERALEKWDGEKGRQGRTSTSLRYRAISKKHAFRLLACASSKLTAALFLSPFFEAIALPTSFRTVSYPSSERKKKL